MNPRNLFIGALASLILSLAVYALLAGLLAWWFLAGFLSNADIMFGATRMRGLLTALAWFVPAICLWWLAVPLAGRQKRAPFHRLVAGADLLLLFAAMVYGLWAYAVQAERFPRDYFTCGWHGFQAICAGPKGVYFWGGLGLAAALFLIGLRQRLKGVRADPPPAHPG